MDNAAFGAQFGLVLGALLSLWIVALMLGAGSSQIPMKHGRTLDAGRAIAVYLSAGATLGALIGLLRSLFRTRAGALALGIISCFPLAVGFSWVSRDGGLSDPDALITILIFSMVIGGPSGLIIRDTMLSREKQDQASD